jgi:Flp pilus assembly protein CpaB
MRSRGLVVAIAIVLAIVAAAAVILYTNQVRENAIADEATQVVISTQDIAVGTQLDPLLEQGAFDTINVPNDALVEDAVIRLDQLAGQTTTAPILAREQIPRSRLSSGSGSVSQAGVTDGHVGVALSLEGPRAGAGAIRLGDNVAVYVTFNKDTVVLNSTLSKILSPAQLAKFIAAQQGQGDPNGPAVRLGADFTATVVPSTRVIQIAVPTTTDANGQQTTTEGTITVMLDLLPEEAQTVVFANERASVWFGLLPPTNKDGYETEAVVGPTLDDLLGKRAV